MSRLDRIERGVASANRPVRARGARVVSDNLKQTITVNARARGFGGMQIEEVKNLPNIPTDKPKVVWWVSSNRGGTGDGQLWVGLPGQTRWYPLCFITDKSGLPGS